MYKWISVVAIGSTVLWSKKFPDTNIQSLFNHTNSIGSNLIDMTSVMDAFSYDYDWMPPNALFNDEFDTQNTCSPISHQLDTHTDVEQYSPTNQMRDISQINSELNQFYSFANEMPTIEMMNEFDNDNFDNEEDEWRWRDKLKKHRKTSNFGFSTLQKRIERVKNDIINLTNKLNSGYSANVEQSTTGGDGNSYYNLGFGNGTDAEDCAGEEWTSKEGELACGELSKDGELEYCQADSGDSSGGKTWRCPSQVSPANPYAELSENTQKILSRYHLSEESPPENQFDEKESSGEIDDLEMEEDDIEFTFYASSNGLLQSYLSKGTLPIIEEEEEEAYSSGEDDTDSVGSAALVSDLVIDIDTPQTVSVRSTNVTDSESFVTALSNPDYINHQIGNDKRSSSFEDAEENFSDYARYSVSTHSSEESLNSCKIDRFENGTMTDRTLVNHDSNLDCTFVCKNTENCSSSSIKIDRSSDSDAEYDQSIWSNEDILQSIEQSDSLYDQPVKSLIKSSLPDLIESSDNFEMNNVNNFYGNRNLNKSTDLDELLLQQSPYHPNTINRLSASLCNLNTARSDHKVCPQRFFQDTISQSNLLETDLDSGFVSIYQPIKETEILPSVNFSCSMVNISQEKSPVAFNSLIEKLKSKAGSIPELRVANSLNKLNVPDWLNYRQDDSVESSLSPEINDKPYTTQSLQLPPNHFNKSPMRQFGSFSRAQKVVSPEPPNKPQLKSPIILPSQKLKQSTGKRLNPIKSCRARELLLPNKIAIGTL